MSRTTYRLVGVAADVFEYDQETGEQGEFVTAKHVDYMDFEGNLEKIDEHLASFGLPPMKDWTNRYAEDVDAEPGYYETEIFENEHDHQDDKGAFNVMYFVRLEKLEISPVDLR